MKDELLKAIRETFRLEGEDVIRISNGRVVLPQPSQKYSRIGFPCGGVWKATGYHRIKFALLRGYLPATVDHEDRDPSNNLGGNLRDADGSLQNHNRELFGKYARGVRPSKRSKKNPFQAGIYIDGKYNHLGMFPTEAAGSDAFERAAREKYGENYVEPTRRR